MIVTTSLKALRLAHAVLVIGLLGYSNIASGQVQIRPGESVEWVPGPRASWCPPSRQHG